MRSSRRTSCRAAPTASTGRSWGSAATGSRRCGCRRTSTSPGCSTVSTSGSRSTLWSSARGSSTASSTWPDAPVAPERVPYGDDPAQWADLYRAEGASRGVVVVIHGGFWRARYDATLGVPLAVDLAARGWTAWNLEYRRVGTDTGGGGGWPATCDDIAAGIDRLADVPDLDLSGPVVTLGHSAGGHLATWAASRSRSDRWRPVRVAVTAVVSQAGVLDLRRAHTDKLGN